ncbi:MAG: response regulator [Candidatus Omnitrophota bacterium]|nr:response regulator [Candidatus Omnitrophota bacterium]
MPKKSILLIDDDRTFLAMMSKKLGEKNYLIHTAANGQEGLDKAQSIKPHLVILDVLMPEVTGYDFVQRLKGTEGSLMTSIIVITSRKSMETYFDSSEIKGVMIKPFEPATLLKKVEEVIGVSSEDDGRTRSLRKTGSVKNLMVICLSEFLNNKIRDYMATAGISVFLAMDEEVACKKAVEAPPDFVFCQVYEDSDKLDAEKIAKKFKDQESTQNVPLFFFCPEALSLDTVKILPASQLIIFSESSDLLKQMEEVLKNPQSTRSAA